MILLAQIVATYGAATNGSDDELKLRPPRNEMPPSYWDQNAAWIIAASGVVLVVLCVAIWYFARARPPAVIPAEVRARKDLEALASQPVDRQLLTGISQILKRYFIEAFDLPKQEMTTAEFCRAASSKPEIGLALVEEVSSFLKSCDSTKFTAGPVGNNPTPEAIRIVQVAEARRAELRAAKQTKESASLAPKA